MKACAAIIIWLSVLAVSFASSASLQTLRSVRDVLVRPDEWSDMGAVLRSLDSAVDAAADREKHALIEFRSRLAGYRSYFSGRRFTLSIAERRTLVRTIRAYEESFHSERRKLVEIWRADPKREHGCIDAADLARRYADYELDLCATAFARHNWIPNRPNDLAAAYIAVARAFGEMLVVLYQEEPNKAPEPTPGSVTPRAIEGTSK